MNKRIDFSHLGGFPATQETLAWMQDSFRNGIQRLAQAFGNKVILFGCEVAGGNVSDGAVIIDGEVLPFIAGPYANGDEVVVVETAEPAVSFENNDQHEVYFTKVARIGSPGGFPFTDLKSVETLLELKEAHDELRDDFDNHNHSYNNLTDLPYGKVVHMGSQNIGDITSTDFSATIAIPNQGGTNYHVLLTVWANNTTHANHNDLSWVLYDKQAASFKISFREHHAVAQNVRVEFIIIKAQ